jgi:DNA-directed RNA polymerase subunit RPC12/RpoP
MIHDAQHSYDNSCTYCGHMFKDMGHGLADITLDIVDPSQPPYYAVNVRWVCATCNREKSRTPPALWGARRACWELWTRRTKHPIQPNLF